MAQENDKKVESRWEGVKDSKEKMEAEAKKEKENAQINIPIRNSDKIKQRTFSISEKHIDMLSAMKIMSQVQEGEDKNLSDLIMEGLELLWEQEYQSSNNENNE